MGRKSLLSLIVTFLLIANIYFVSAECEESQINLNTASQEELTDIIYVGEVTAGYIIEARPFTSLDQLLNVSGIGEVKLTAIKSQGLACVGGIIYHITNESAEEESLQDTTEEAEIKKYDNAEPVVIKVVSSNIKNYSSESISEGKYVLELNSKDIKMQNNNKKLSENKIFLYLCLLTFTMFIITMLTINNYIKVKKKRNEFR